MERFYCWGCLGTGQTLSFHPNKTCPKCQGLGYTGDSADYIRSEEMRDRERNRDYNERHSYDNYKERF